MGPSSDRHHRRSIRLPEADYRGHGAFFITICAFRRACLFGEVVEEQLCLNELGRIVQDEWRRSAELRQEVTLDTAVVMPNHLHALVILTPQDATGAARPALRQHAHTDAAPLALPARSLGSLVAGFKAATTRRVNERRGTPGLPVWQRNYWEHIVRDDESFDRLRDYIETNPARWTLDRENPAVPGRGPGRQ